MKTFFVSTRRVQRGLTWPKINGLRVSATPPIGRQTAFSLVEVVLALGLVSFCLIAIVGLLPVGLKAVKNSREESAAANALNQFSEAMRNATNSGGTYGAVGFPDVTWTLGSGSNSFTESLSLFGQPTTTDPRLKAQVNLVPPSDMMTPGRALITIAWPSAATWSNNAWKKSDGSVSASIQFLPKQ